HHATRMPRGHHPQTGEVLRDLLEGPARVLLRSVRRGVAHGRSGLGHAASGLGGDDGGGHGVPSVTGDEPGRGPRWRDPTVEANLTERQGRCYGSSWHVTGALEADAVQTDTPRGRRIPRRTHLGREPDG